MAQQAFVLRIAPGGTDRVPEALSSNQIIIGWAEAVGLLNDQLNWEAFRGIICKSHYAADDNMLRAGQASGHMWRFLREMNEGDLVVVPYGSEFYVAKVTGPATYDPLKQNEGTSYRRNVQWLTNKKPIPRNLARSALISRMKTQGTCASATDLLPQIQDCVELTYNDSSPTFHQDLKDRLIQETLNEIRTGRIDSFGFEHLIREVLSSLGADEARVVPRQQDKGADVVATFTVAGAFRQIVAVQAKHWQPEPPVGADVVEQLINGIEAESANLGMIITSGTISADAEKQAQVFYEKTGLKIELIDGEQFAKLIVENGIRRN